MFSVYIHKNKVVVDNKSYYLGELSADFLNIQKEYMFCENQFRLVKKYLDICNKDFNKENLQGLIHQFEKLLDILEPFIVFGILNKEYREITEIVKEINSFGLKKIVKDTVGIFSEWTNFNDNRKKDDKKIFQMFRERVIDFNIHLHDIRAFNHTMHFFINEKLMKLKSLNDSNHGKAYFSFINSDEASYWIANPINNHNTIYRNVDFYNISYLPRETEKDSGKFEIYEHIECCDLQSFLKLDFMRALINGHTFRRCQHCGKYFMITKRYHTIYCHNPSPENPNYTCHQIGSLSKREGVSNTPKSQSVRRALDRVGHDFKRGVISATDKELLCKTISDIYHKGITSTNISNYDFENSLQPKALYSQCGIIRKANPRGRPKKKEEFK